MAAPSWNIGTFSVILLAMVGTLSVVEGIKCYQCGTYIVTSVTPCQNLTAAALKECPADFTHCSKYSGPAINVYGCEKNCEEKVQNSFEIHCCNEDKCNGGNSQLFSGVFRISFWMVSIPSLLLLAPALTLFNNNPMV